MNSNITKIILERHGESIGNAERRCLGHTDLDLSPLGYRQAEIAARALAEEKIDAIYSSDLVRAHNTAVPHARIRGIEVIDDENLREIFLGEWEGASVERLETECYDQFVLGWRKSFGTFCPPGGESVQALGERIYDEVVSLAKQNAGRTILLTSHAAAIRAFWGKVTNVPPEELVLRVEFPTNASFTTVIFDGEKFIPLSFSDDRHFKDTASAPVGSIFF